MTAFADYLDLRTAVVEQSADDRIVDVFPRLVKLCEAYLNRTLRCREQVSETTLSFSSGSASLPSDFAEAIGLYDSNGFEYVQQPLQSVRVSSGTSTFYAIGASTITMSAADSDRTLQYYTKIPTITDSMGDSNWLLQKHPAVYLYGVGYEAEKWRRDVEAAQATRLLLDMEIRAANAADADERYSRSRVRVAGATP